MRTVLISRKRGEVKGVPRGEEPRIEIKLGDDQRIISFERQIQPGGAGEETDDWRWTAFVSTPVGGQS